MKPSEWRQLTMSDLASGGGSGIAGGPFGSALGRKDYVPSGVPVIRGAQLSNGGRFSFRDVVFVNEAKADRHQRNLAFPGDVVVTQRGTLGQVGIVPQDVRFDRYLLSQSQMKITVDDRIADANFLYHLLSAPETVDRLRGHALVAGVPHINLSILRAFPVHIPPVSLQRRIARVLSAFDDLAANNERRIEILEALARSLYREWFVRFRYQSDSDSGFVGSDVGPIPSTWKRATLADVTSVLTRGIAPGYSEDGRWLVINQKCIRDQRLSLRTARRHEGNVPKAKRLEFGDVIVNSTGVGTLGRVAAFLSGEGHATVDSHVTIARAKSAAMQPWFILHMFGRQAEFEAMGAGSTGQTELSRQAVGELKLAVPDVATMTAFGAIVGPLLASVPQLMRRNAVLAATRDLLLPRLVTGRLDISEIDLGDLLPGEAA